MKTEYRILLNADARTRKRLDMVRMILALQPELNTPGTWDNVIKWLVETVPIPELLAELVNPPTTEAPKGE